MTVLGVFDVKEPHGIQKLLLKASWISKQLSAGDYITDRFIFERKTPSDFLQSLFDKRYKFQLAKMMATEKKIVYIIEGNLKKGFLKWTGGSKPTYDFKKQKKYVEMISSLQAKYDISVVSTTTPSMTAHLLMLQ